MKHLNNKTKFGSSILTLALCIFFILLFACGDGSGTSDEPSSDTDESSPDTGSIAFSLAWEEAASKSGVLGVLQAQAVQSPSDDVCVDYEIDTITAEVYNSSGTEIASASWPCSDHGGTISDVSTGSGMYLIVEGTVAGSVDWQGQTTSFTVSAGQTTKVGTVTMNYIGEDVTPPTVYPTTTTPSDGDTNVSISVAITATFSEKMVLASVNPTTFTLETNGTRLDGSVNYDPSTHTASFTPESNLSISTNHTVTITTEVEDITGNQMADNYTWSFTTANIAWIEEAGSIVKVSSAQEELITIDQINCSGLSGIMQFAIDQNDGGLWIADTNNNRIMKLDEQGELVVLVDQYSASGIAVDPRDGSVWTSEYVPADDSRKLIKRSSIGLPILETATGLSLVTGADNAMSWYPDDNSLWCADRFPKNIIKLFGTDAELDGYDASGASDTNHSRIGGFVGEAFSVSVYPGDGMGVSGHVWAADRLSVIIKFSANGSEVLRREPTGFYEARDLSVDVSDGSVWVMDPNNDRIAKYSPEGDELVNKGFAYTRTIEADPFDGGAWLGLSEGLVKLSASGAVEWTRTTSTVDAIALPSQVNKKVTIYVSNGGSDTDGSGSKENPFRTIEKAITQAKYGDTVVVEAGIYNRNVSLKSGIRVIGAGADVTMIQGPGTGNVIEGISIQNATISGFTITGAADFNSIISCIDCNGIIIRENIITGNGMLSYRGDNGIVLQEKTQALVERNVITGNTSDGIFLANTVQAIIRNNIIANNGVGIFRGSGSLTSYIINNVIDSNGKPEYSGRSGIMIIGIEGIEDNDVIKNNIVSNNGYNNPNPGLSVGIYVGGGATPELSYNNVYNNYQGEYTGVAPGTGDISADSLYVDLASGDYHLKSGSPSENTGDPALYDADIDCSAFPACRSDMGAYGGPWKNPAPPDDLIIIKP